jgi:hypothetical protein
MLVNTERGDCYTLEEIDGWFTTAGLERCEILELGAHSRLVTAVKP